MIKPQTTMGIKSHQKSKADDDKDGNFWRSEFKFFRYVYWGEYPLAFAACLGQEECYRLVLAKGADPNGQDTNGNTVLHMLVIYDKIVI